MYASEMGILTVLHSMMGAMWMTHFVFGDEKSNSVGLEQHLFLALTIPLARPKLQKNIPLARLEVRKSIPLRAAHPQVPLLWKIPPWQYAM